MSRSNRHFLALSLALVVAVALVASPALAAARWLRLAAEPVAGGGTTVLDVDGKKPAVEALRLRAQKAGVTLSKVDVTFADGSTQSFEKRMTLTADAMTGELRFDQPGKVKSIAIAHGDGSGAVIEAQGLI